MSFLVRKKKLIQPLSSQELDVSQNVGFFSHHFASFYASFLLYDELLA